MIGNTSAAPTQSLGQEKTTLLMLFNKVLRSPPLCLALLTEHVLRLQLLNSLSLLGSNMVENSDCGCSPRVFLSNWHRVHDLHKIRYLFSEWWNPFNLLFKFLYSVLRKSIDRPQRSVDKCLLTNLRHIRSRWYWWVFRLIATSTWCERATWLKSFLQTTQIVDA